MSDQPRRPPTFPYSQQQDQQDREQKTGQNRQSLFYNPGNLFWALMLC
jgi:hypothetical protein